MASRLTRQVLRFAIAGALVTTLHVVTAAGLIGLALQSPALANGVAFLLATAFSYVINTVWSFAHPLFGSNLPRYIVVSVAGCLLAAAVSAIAEVSGLHYLPGIALVVCIVPPATFLGHSFWNTDEQGI